MNILFTIAVGIPDAEKPERWNFICELYENLGKSLQQLGYKIYYAVNSKALNQSSLNGPNVYICDNHDEFDNVLSQISPNFVFCWNGNSDADTITSNKARLFGAKMIFSELGWFPQRGNIYFDAQGVNGEVSFKRHNGKLWVAEECCNRLWYCISEGSIYLYEMNCKKSVRNVFQI